MGALRNFWGQLDWWGLLSLCLSAAAALLCITFHELSHGYTAYRLGISANIIPVRSLEPLAS